MPIPLDAANLVGQTLSGRYQLCRLLGQGGMGVVYEALDLTLLAPCAVKLQKLPLAAPQAHGLLRRRFRREIRLGQTVRHPGLVAVLDAGQLADGTAFLVMELLRGWNLFDVLTAAGTVPWDEALVIGVQAAAALEALHRAGVVHRDIKPENLFLLPDGRVKVMDLGVLRSVDGLQIGDSEDTDVRTRSNEALGTLAFMAPEQIQHCGQVDGRADLYALGLVLWEAITGEQPFRGLPWLEVTQRKFSPKPVPPARSRMPQVPAELDALLMRCLEAAPRRPATAALLEAELTALLPEPEAVLRLRLAQRAQQALPADAAASSGEWWVPADESNHRPAGTWPLPPPAAVVSERSPASARWRPERRRWLPALGFAAATSALWMFRSEAPQPLRGHEPDAGRMGAVPAQAPQLAASAVGTVSPPLPTPALPSAPRASAPTAVGATPGPARTLTPRALTRNAAAPTLPQAASAARGRLYIAVHPFAEIFIDGVHRSEATPHTYELPAGTHRVRLLNSAMGIDAQRLLTIRPDATERLVLDGTSR